MPFFSLGLSEPIVRAVAERGYTVPTPVQMQAIPAVLTGGDLLAGAQTGTGKTAGFTLPILERLSRNPVAGGKGRHSIRALVLTPTRELAAQVEESVREYGKHLDLKSMVMFGGVSINPQIAQLKDRVDILVATPGRLLDHVEQKTLDLSRVEILVLDEADRMLDMGFIRDIRKILALLPKKRQNLLFSATFSDEIKALADGLLDAPAMIEVARRNAPAELVDQKVIRVEPGSKAQLLAHLIKQHSWFQVLVFTRTKHRANWLAERLAKDGIPALAIHGNKSQNARTRALAQFKDATLQVLVATDIAARGLDIVDLPHVVNYELPNVPEDYVHRIGRTGRAGSSGEALSLVARDEVKLLADIEKLIRRTLPHKPVEGFEPVPEAVSAEREPRPGQKRPPREVQKREPREGDTRPGRKSRDENRRERPPRPENAPAKRPQNGQRPPRPDSARGAWLLSAQPAPGQAVVVDETGEPNGNVLAPGWKRDELGNLIPPERPQDRDGNQMAPKPQQGERRGAHGRGKGASPDTRAAGQRRSKGTRNEANRGRGAPPARRFGK